MDNPYPSFRPLVAVVGFHHHRGPEIESWFGVPPGVDPAIENDWSFLPFMALADGAHASTEDFSYFTLRRKLSPAAAHQSSSAELAPDTSSASTAAAAQDGSLPEVVAAEVPDIVAPTPVHPPAASDLTSTPRASTTETPSISRGTTPLPSRPKYGAGASVFAMSCTRQLKAEELLVRPSDVTRSTVQKSVVVLVGSRPGRFAGWREKLGAVTRSWFMQRDFEDREILKHFQESLVESEKNYEDEPDHFLGISLRRFIFDFRHQALTLFKCALLQPKMLFFGHKTENICMIQFALISLIPGLIRHLEDCADPELDTYAQNAFIPTTLRTSNRDSLLEYMGLPLQIFGKGAFFGPYTPLQQLDLLSDPATKSYIVGSTNTLLLQHKEGGPDVIIDVDEKTITMNEQALRPALNLSAADRRWIDSIHQTVASTWDPENPTQPTSHGYLGSEDFIRFQFEEYVLALLAANKYQSYFHATPPKKRDLSSFPEIEGDPTLDFAEPWLERWRQTPNFTLWNKFTDSHLFDIVEPKHPTAGGLSVDDIQRRFAQQIQDLHLESRVAASREALGKHLATGQKKVSTAFSSLWAELEARREVQRERWGTAGRSTAPTPPHAAEGIQTRQQAAAQAAAPYVEAASVRASQAQAAAAAAGQRASAYLSGWGAWASEKRKGWGRNPSSNNLKEEASRTETQSMDETRSTSPAARTGGVNWSSKNDRSLRVSTGNDPGSEKDGTYSDAATPDATETTLWDAGTDGTSDKMGSPERNSKVCSPPPIPMSPTGSTKSGPGSNRRSLSKRMSGRFGGPKSTKSRERIVDGIGRIDAP